MSSCLWKKHNTLTPNPAETLSHSARVVELNAGLRTYVQRLDEHHSCGHRLLYVTSMLRVLQISFLRLLWLSRCCSRIIDKKRRMTATASRRNQNGSPGVFWHGPFSVPDNFSLPRVFNFRPW